MSNVLIATLGESPIVITAMVDKLTKQEGIEIDRAVIVYPQGEYVADACLIVSEELSIRPDDMVEMSFEDANGKAQSFEFLHKLCAKLSECERAGDDVYLSLAGGRKNMSALTAILAPLFPCVKGLYHILTSDHKNVVDIVKLKDYPHTQLKRALHPDVSKFVLVKIPFGERQHMSKEYRSRLFTITDEQWDEWWEANPVQAEAAEFAWQFLRPDVMGEIVDVWVTEHVEHEYQQMKKYDKAHARNFDRCFRQMRYATRLRAGIHTYHGLCSPFFFYKRPQTPERPLFYLIEPKKNDTGVSKVVITGLAIEREHKYQPPLEQLKTLPTDPKVRIDALLSEESDLAEDAPSSTDSVLVVPLGGTPMVATQFYALRQQKGCRVQEVIVLYPKAQMVINSLGKVREALEGEHVKLQEVPVPLEDLASSEDCEIYLQELVKTIEKAQTYNPHCQIELLLSGGRKGMAALAMFAAQQTGLRYVYHTLIEDRELFKRVEKETAIEALNKEPIKQRRIDRLLLHAYSEDLEKFALFEVPVLPSAGK